MRQVIEGFMVALAMVVGGYFLGIGIVLAFKTLKISPIQQSYEFKADLLASEEAMDELNGFQDSGPGLPDHLKGYHS